MTRLELANERRVLLTQFRWVISLRWIAATVIMAGSLADLLWLHWYPHSKLGTLLGATILLYNILFYVAIRQPSRRRPPTLLLAWLQILLDLAGLSLLTLWTGGPQSPLLGFFVLHMVFASLLLSRPVAFAAAAVAIVFLVGGLLLQNRWPDTLHDKLLMIGWALTLLVTVFLANHITMSLRRHRARLVVRNRRIRELADRLRHQQRAMVQHEKMVAMGQLAAGVAHEVSNPLASIDGVLQLMQRNTQRLTTENVSILRQQVDRIKQTVQQLTSFAHPTEYTWRNMPVNELVEAALQMVRFDRRHRAVQVNQQFTSNGCLVRVQPHAMQQVLINILLNALDAMADVPQSTLTVATECAAGVCRIAITDNGSGIAPEYLDRIFEPFFTTKPVGKGTGLGLAISYSLVRSQGGYVQVDSEPGKGTTMTIVLPHLAAEAPAPTPSASVPV
jgi:signal transduction histidine kinase